MREGAISKDVVNWIAIACDQSPELQLHHVILLARTLLILKRWHPGTSAASGHLDPFLQSGCDGLGRTLLFTVGSKQWHHGGSVGRHTMAHPYRLGHPVHAGRQHR
jgi:hypothetical protein